METPFQNGCDKIFFLLVRKACRQIVSRFSRLLHRQTLNSNHWRLQDTVCSDKLTFSPRTPAVMLFSLRYFTPELPIRNFAVKESCFTTRTSEFCNELEKYRPSVTAQTSLGVCFLRKREIFNDLFVGYFLSSNITNIGVTSRSNALPFI